MSINAPYNASYQKTSVNQAADPQGRNVTVFCDGHAKAITVSELLTSKNDWSRTGNGQWP